MPAGMDAKKTVKNNVVTIANLADPADVDPAIVGRRRIGKNIAIAAAPIKYNGYRSIDLHVKEQYAPNKLLLLAMLMFSFPQTLHLVTITHILSCK